MLLHGIKVKKVFKYLKFSKFPVSILLILFANGFTLSLVIHELQYSGINQKSLFFLILFVAAVYVSNVLLIGMFLTTQKAWKNWKQRYPGEFNYWYFLLNEIYIVDLTPLKRELRIYNYQRKMAKEKTLKLPQYLRQKYE